MPIIRLVYWGTFPAVILLTTHSKALVRFSGGDVTRTGPFVTEEDIAFMIRLGQREGVFEKQEGQLLESIFEFGDTLVKEVMVLKKRKCLIPS